MIEIVSITISITGICFSILTYFHIKNAWDKQVKEIEKFSINVDDRLKAIENKLHMYDI